MRIQLRLILAILTFLAAATMSAQYVVTSLSDLPDADLTDNTFAPATLRSAIQNINKRSVAATLSVSAELEYKTLTISSPLPAITPKVTFDGKGLVISGANNSSVTHGLFISGDGSIVRNLKIENINGSGLVWQANDGLIEKFIIRNCNGPGMNFNRAKRNVVGGERIGYYSNYVYGCTGNGGSGIVFIEGSSDNEIQYCAVGIDETYHKKSNSRYGIHSEDARQNIHHNLVGGNEWGGIYLDGRNLSLFSRVYSNRIGVNETASDTIPNIGFGISIFQSSDDTIRNNIVSGNDGTGILISSRDCSRIMIRDNVVGTDPSTTKPLPNTVGIGLNGKDHYVFNKLNSSSKCNMGRSKEKGYLPTKQTLFRDQPWSKHGKCLSACNPITKV
ncbi:MAG: right-handed parallel beta-helix repeat-containing protein, partial [Candidatus Kapabacteria bacterium]|nr:right-handed parallel beta-helix repeat-containing protein [Candidatus Kapabacteria bacterium]